MFRIYSPASVHQNFLYNCFPKTLVNLCGEMTLNHILMKRISETLFLAPIYIDKHSQGRGVIGDKQVLK